MFIRKKKLIEMLKEKQLQIRKENQTIKANYISKKNIGSAVNWQFYEDGNDNAFNWIIGRLERKKRK